MGGQLQGASLTEINATTGALVRVISGPAYQFGRPDAVAAASGDLWVTNENASVTEIDETTGALVRVVRNCGCRLAGGCRRGRQPCVGRQCPNSDVTDDRVSELNAKTGKLVRVISASQYGFNGPAGVAATGKRVWVTNSWADSVTELNAKTGALVRVISGKKYGLNAPSVFASLEAPCGSLTQGADGGHRWGRYPVECHDWCLGSGDLRRGLLVQRAHRSRGRREPRMGCQ